jgi:hypothetical protein
LACNILEVLDAIREVTQPDESRWNAFRKLERCGEVENVWLEEVLRELFDYKLTMKNVEIPVDVKEVLEKMSSISSWFHVIFVVTAAELEPKIKVKEGYATLYAEGEKINLFPEWRFQEEYRGVLEEIFHAPTVTIYFTWIYFTW